MTLKTKHILNILLLIQDAYEYKNVRKWRMCNENETNEKEKTNEKTLQDRHEELRRWFESVGDCV